MKWIITHNQEYNFVEIIVQGTIKAIDTVQMTHEGLSLARSINSSKFLIDYSSTEVADSTMDTYGFMSNLSNIGITHQDRISILISCNQYEHDFAETIAINRGWSNIKYHNNREKAVAWLTKYH